MIYTPLRQTAPDKLTRPSYINSLALKAFTTENISAELNRQHRGLSSNFVVKGFDVIIKGMSIIISNGVCVLKHGQSLKYRSHNDNIFYVTDPMPNSKTLNFYLAIGRTNNYNGDAVLKLFKSEKISNDWLVIKKLSLPKNSNDLSDMKIKNLYSPYGVKIYNFMPNQPDGNTMAVLIPFEISDLRLFVNGELYTNFYVRNKGTLTEAILGNLLSQGDTITADFTAYY